MISDTLPLPTVTPNAADTPATPNASDTRERAHA